MGRDDSFWAGLFLVGLCLVAGLYISFHPHSALTYVITHSIGDPQ